MCFSFSAILSLFLSLFNRNKSSNFYVFSFQFTICVSFNYFHLVFCGFLFVSSLSLSHFLKFFFFFSLFSIETKHQISTFFQSIHNLCFFQLFSSCFLLFSIR